MENLMPPNRAATFKDYLEIARIDHWFKNIFMLFGVLFAFFHNPMALNLALLPNLLIAILSVCLVASSNYVLNEIKDARYDSVHPKKKYRPIPSGRVRVSVAYIEWILFLSAGIVLAMAVNVPFLLVTFIFLLMGIFYNIQPFRLKDLPYIDVLAESLNNPIRLLLGWFVVVQNQLPSISLLLTYWFIGSFFMAIKRYAEYQSINNPEIAGSYRKSFHYYDEKRLLISMFFYISLASLFFGIFIIKYHFELILITPLIAGFVSYYLKIGLKEDSPVQNPERLYREKGLIAYAVLCLIAFIIILLTDIPILYEWFKIEPPSIHSLWKIVITSNK